MAKAACVCFFLFFFSAQSICSTGTLVGFSYDARGSNAIASLEKTVSFLKINKVSSFQIRVFLDDASVLKSLNNTGVSVDFYLDKVIVDFSRSRAHAINWLKTHLMSSLPHVKIKTIILSSSSYNFSGSNSLLASLKSIYSALHHLHLQNQVKVSVSFPLSFFIKLDSKHEVEVHKVIHFIKKVGSYAVLQASIDGELRMGDTFVESIIGRAYSGVSLLPLRHVSKVLIVKSSAVPSAIEVANFSDKLASSLSKASFTCKVDELFADITPIRDFEKKELEREEEEIFHYSHRELFHLEVTSHDLINPPTTTFPPAPLNNPVESPISVPTYNPAPNVVAVPNPVYNPANPVYNPANPVYNPANPVNTPANPVSSPLTVPPSTPIPYPSTPIPYPSTSPAPLTNPVTNPVTTPPVTVPVTNPVTTYPPPQGNVPVTTPVIPPATNIPGQTWCVAKGGVPESSLQSALDYACGIGGADCSTIQLGATCYNPSTLQNHASYAFNSYYQKNPSATSCDFGGTAMLVNNNPSSGSCVYPSSATSSTPSAPLTATPTPVPTTYSNTGGSAPGYVTPPTVLNSSNPGSVLPPLVFGSEPPVVNTTISSASSTLQPSFIGCVLLGLAASFIAQ